VLASDNRGKLAEIRQLLAGLEVEVVPQAECGITGAEETGASFRENALIKARHASAAAGIPAIADDSGLEVAALDGQPGVRSARFAGDSATDAQNIDRLLAELSCVNESRRQARFRCIAAYVENADDRAPLLAEGVWHGRILKARRGSGGFGYDPVFYDPALKKTAAEMSVPVKNRLSHRGQAFRKLGDLLSVRLRLTNGEG
jgi:XTP/dITP diphosphohydrolase